MKLVFVLMFTLLAVGCGTPTDPAPLTTIVTVHAINQSTAAPVAQATLTWAAEGEPAVVGLTNATGDVSVTVRLNRPYVVQIEAAGFHLNRIPFTPTTTTDWIIYLIPIS